MERKPRIYVYRPHTDYEDVMGLAFDELGEVVAWHVSSSLSWFRSDMGLRSEYKHNKYQARHPNGFELVEVIGKEKLLELLPHVSEEHL